jgi:Asp-tRNA(Asn)/Glu-tRNA(Gln) amidotransferase C subunit
MLLENIKQFVEEISRVELNHLDPIRVRIFLSGLIQEEEMRMGGYTTEVIPSLVKELNDLLDLVNDIEPASKLQHDDLFEIATSLTTIRDKVVKEFLI